MSYIDKDQSRDDAAPVALYEFKADTFVFRYTDNARAIDALGHTFSPRQVDRSAITYSASLGDTSKVTVTLPENDQLSYLVNGLMTPEVFTVTIYELHLTDPDAEAKQIFLGFVTSVSTENRETLFTCVSLMQTHMDVSIPTVAYSRTCKHKFGDDHCGYNLEQVKYEGIVIADLNLWTITLSAVVPSENDYVGGTVKNMRTGKTQDVAALDGVTLLTLGGFLDAEIGDALTFYKACDHQWAGDCADYGNQINFGGFPFTPRKNPFVQGFGERVFTADYYYYEDE